jgi:hypothetical protein
MKYTPQFMELVGPCVHGNTMNHCADFQLAGTMENGYNVLLVADENCVGFPIQLAHEIVIALHPLSHY